MSNIDIENCGFTLCQTQPKQKDHIWVPEEGTVQQFDSIRALYAPEGQQVDSSEIPFVQMRV
jgi:hypothetical protein